MKTLCTCASALFRFHPARRFVVSLAATLVFLAINAGAGVTPLPVPADGVTVDFSTLPTTNTGWATASWAGGNTTPNTVAGMDTAAKTNNAADIVAAFVTDAVNPTPAFPTAAAFLWNSFAHNLESRPTGNSYNALLLTLRNASSADQNKVTIDYDFNALFPTGTLETEDEANALAGFRLYYSFSGLPTSWIHLPSFDGGLATVGHKGTNLDITATPWEVGANMFLLWTDDNAVTGTGPGTAPGSIEGPYTIDNVAVGFGICDPPAITSQPQALVHVETCRDTNLTVVATGPGLHYHWFHGANVIPTALGPTLTLTSAQAADAGSYHCVVTNCTGTVGISSQPSTVVVDPDNDLPTVVSALAKADGFTYVIHFDENIDASSINFQGFHVNPLAGGGLLEMTNAVLANGTNLTIQSDTLRSPNVEYELIIDPGIADCSGNVVADVLTVPLTYEVRLVAVENTPWKYNHEGVDLSLDFIDPGYDDSGWSNGVSVLDAKSTPRTVVSGQNVMTQLPLRFAQFVADDVPVYYFRTHFSLPSSLSQITELHLRTFVDDYVVLYLNGDGTPLHADMGNGDQDVFRYGYSGGGAIGDANFLPTTGFYSKNPAALLDGDNFIAAKVFQQTNTSSDITFAIELTAVVTGFKSVGPQLTIVSDGAGHVTVTWPAGTGALLYEASVVDAGGIGGPTGWSLAAGQSDGLFSATVPGAGGVQKFYSLRQ